MFEFQGMMIIKNDEGEYLEASDKKKKDNQKYKGD